VREPANEVELGNIFEGEEASEISRSFGIKKVSRKARNNFSKVIRAIAHSAKQSGNMRCGLRYSRRMPTKISTDNLLNIERGGELFKRPEFNARQYAIFLDVSGSVDAFIPFVNGLMHSLGCADRPLRLYCWADRVEEVPINKLGREEQPDVGSGTNGEMLAGFIAEAGVKEAVVITDNAAGTISTKINARVTLCLFPDSTLSGSFLDKTVVPLCRVHQLEVDEDEDVDDGLFQMAAWPGVK
jgi:hypothetical protein